MTDDENRDDRKLVEVTRIGTLGNSRAVELGASINNGREEIRAHCGPKDRYIREISVPLCLEDLTTIELREYESRLPGQGSRGREGRVAMIGTFGHLACYLACRNRA